MKSKDIKNHQGSGGGKRSGSYGIKALALIMLSGMMLA